MAKSKEQQAQEYAEKKIESEYGISREDFIEAGCRFGYGDVVQAHIDGYTACEQSIWRSVEEELPEEGQAIIIRVVHKEAKSGKMFESWFNAFYFKQYGFDIEERPQRGKISKVTHWMPKPDLPIPSLPDTNTEKK